MLSRALLIVGAIGILAATPSLAQEVQDTAAALEMLRRGLETGQITPEQVRQRIEAAGMTLDDVRQRLREAGYPPSLLDEYLQGGVATMGDAALTPLQIENVLRRLSIAPLDPLSTLDSLMMIDTLFADSLLLDTTRVATMPELPVFGRALFEGVGSQFFPVTTGPVPPNYQLGPGDELVLILTGDIQEIYTLPVTREGFVVIPNVGRVSVNGLTLEQLRNALYTYLGEVYSGVRRGPEATTLFEVSIASLRRNQVFVIGEVERPGQYQVTSVSDALEALYQAGGPTEQGSFRNILIRRGDQVAAVLDLYEYLTTGAVSDEMTLDQGDVVFVPVRGPRIEVDGNVIRPGIYELKGDEGLRALLEHAGGIEPEADLRRVQIDRVLPPEERRPGVQRELIDVDVAELLDSEGQFIALQPGDKVYVFAVTDTRRNTVTVRGNVWSPGVYAYRDGMSVADLIERAGGLKDDTYLGRAQILRLDPRDLSRRVVPVALPSGEETDLMEYDEVHVFSVAELQEKRYVTVDGAVRDPGVYEFREGMTVRDLVLQAGGLLDEAYLVEAEVARISARPDETGEIATVMTVPIDSSYSVALGAGTEGARGSNGSAAGQGDFVLQRYDKVFIRRQPGWEPLRTVKITGEVRFPGAYALERKDEGIARLIERAGGLTSDAFPEGARFFRLHDLPGQEEPSSMRVNIDLPRVLAGRAEAVPLADGDSIHIPEFLATVQVDGAVLYPTSVLFREGAGLGYYVEMAGGFARDADSGRTWVEFADGSVETVSKFLVFKSSPEPGPGSRIFVPAKPPRAGGVDLRALAAVIGALTTLIVVSTR